MTKDQKHQVKSVSLVSLIRQASILTRKSEVLSLKLELPSVHHCSLSPMPDRCPHYVKYLVSWFAYSCTGEESWKISHRVSNLAGSRVICQIWKFSGECVRRLQYMLMRSCAAIWPLVVESLVSSSTVGEYRGKSQERGREHSHSPS